MRMTCKRVCTLLSVVLFSISSFAFAAYSVIEDQFKEKIKSPSMQNIETLKVRLDNGLEAYIVSDPEAKKSGASLSVGVGWDHEPFDNIGVAHFVEHMLFLGTQKYPTEKEYHEFIQTNGGSSNAYTSNDRTVYSFEINNDQAKEALDRFSSFFVEPLFNESGLSRERKAVNQEFLYRANLDQVRKHMVGLEFVDPSSHENIWRCGTEETLMSISRENLVRWYQDHYSANLMRLAVYSSLPLEQLVEQVDACFSQIENKNHQMTTLQGPITNPDFLGKLVYIEPLKNLKQLSIKWELPPEYTMDLDYHTADLVSDVLSEESPKSLATILKDKGYIYQMHAYQSNTDTKVSFFELCLELTPKGLESYQTVIAQCYEAIHTFKQEGLPRYRQDEMTAIAKLNFQYQSRPEVFSFVEHVASAIQYEDIATFPQKSGWPTQFDAKRVNRFLSMLKPHKAIYFILAPEQLTGVASDLTEKHVQVKYHVQQIPAKTLNEWAHIEANPSIAIAAPNPYIPTNLELVGSIDAKENNPEALDLSERSQFYFQQDISYQVPKVNYNLAVKSPSIKQNGKNKVLADLLSLSLSDALSQHLEQGQLAGLNADFSIDSKRGLLVSVSGYSQKSDLFTAKIFETIKSHQPAEKDFPKYHDILVRSYLNQKKAIPGRQAGEVMNNLVFRDYPLVDDKLAALNEISYKDFDLYNREFFNQVYLQGMLYGNLTKSQAVNLCTNLEALFENSTTYPVSEHSMRAVLEPASLNNPCFFAQSTDQTGSSTFLMIGHGILEDKDRAAYEVMNQAISTPFFDTLRTKQQVGYMVHSFSREYEKQLFTCFLVQSNSCSTRDLLSRYELFNEEFLSTLGTAELDLEKFNLLKQALITNYRQPPVSISDKGQELYYLAFDQKGEFDQKERRVQALEALSYEEFVTFCQNQLGRSNNKRLAVLVNGQMSDVPTIDYLEINNLGHFKAESEYADNSKIQLNETPLKDPSL